MAPNPRPARAGAPPTPRAPPRAGVPRAGAAAAAAAGGFSGYKGVVFDMDGTLTVSNIDFAKMRKLTEIPKGDLFTTMEAWDDDARILKAMTTILELEADAVSTLEVMPGLVELLGYLRGMRDEGVRVAVVTRNTPTSVDGFLRLLGEGSEEYFDEIITRHHRHVKPDFRLLSDLADEWRLDPRDMLMVGDSTEDVECGNAAGTATCLIEGGGNEVSSVRPPPGAIPTFSVTGLPDLLDRLERGDVAPGLGRPQQPREFQVGFTWDDLAPGVSVSQSVDGGALPDSGLAGAPPPGVDFLEDLYARRLLVTADSSFPRMGNAAGGMQGSRALGDRVLHIGAGSGALTKLMASQGMQCVGIDRDVSVLEDRGLMSASFAGEPMAEGSLAPALAVGPRALSGAFDAAVVYQGGSAARREDDAGAAVVGSLVSGGGLEEVARVLKPGGRLLVQAVLAADEKWALMRGLWAAGYVPVYATRLEVPGTRDRMLRLAAVKPQAPAGGSE